MAVTCTDILITADTLSRAPAKHTFTQEEKDNGAVFVDAIIQTLPATERRLKIIQENQTLTLSVPSLSGTVRKGGQENTTSVCVCVC